MAQTRPPAEVLLVDNHPDAVVSTALVERGLPVTQLVDRSATSGTRRPATSLRARFGRRGSSSSTPTRRPPRTAWSACWRRPTTTSPCSGPRCCCPTATVNAGDNPVDLVGLSWSGRYLEPREDGPRARRRGHQRGRVADPHRDVPGPARPLTRVLPLRRRHRHRLALVAGRDARAFRPRGGDQPRLRVRQGRRASGCTSSTTGCGWSSRTTGCATLVLLSPLLLAAEAGIAVLARRDGWWPEKVEAWRAVWAERRRIAAWRRFVQGTRRRATTRSWRDDRVAAHAAGASAGGPAGRAGPRGLPPVVLGLLD